MSANYRGDAAVASNRSADIPEEENCSVWMEGLPRNVTTYQLLGAIRNIGRVWQTHTVRPSGHHVTAAAKVTFFTAAAAQLMIARSRGGIRVQGYLATVLYNRTRVAEPAEPADHTRVLTFLERANNRAGFVVDNLRARARPDHNPVAEGGDSGDPSVVAGPREIVTEQYMVAYFSRRFEYKLDQIDPLVLGRSINVLEFRFGSYRCQAQWAWRNIRDDPHLAGRGVRVKFERDPYIQRFTGFRLMAMLSEAVRLRHENPSALDIARRIRYGVSPNYQGDYRRTSNQPADIPDSENCSLWVIELPADVTHHELWGAIRNVGRVWQT
ncbi:hypothetical protein C8A01DRAFT_35593, partial [Parachaetomium inaequale]